MVINRVEDDLTVGTDIVPSPETNGFIVSPEEQKTVLELRSRQRVEECTRELRDLLAKYQCRLKSDMILSESGVAPIINIVPL